VTVPASDDSGVRNLIASIAHAMDTGSVGELLDLMHPEVTISFAANPAAGVAPSMISGRESVGGWVADRRDAGAQGPSSGTRHIVSNQRVAIEGDGRARSVAYFAYLRSDAEGVAILALGVYDDMAERVDAGWILRSRTVRS